MNTKRLERGLSERQLSVFVNSWGPSVPPLELWAAGDEDSWYRSEMGRKGADPSVEEMPLSRGKYCQPAVGKCQRGCSEGMLLPRHQTETLLTAKCGQRLLSSL
ncbi:unnamed protein product [Rangifer tarandus platyrhynchus]|uniref:Uncharacterized protein n=1 Tax=Rangifer tarandus platyrhynchus TaxID=3082113 RepID=A0AC59ZSM0_RANTA